MNNNSEELMESMAIKESGKEAVMLCRQVDEVCGEDEVQEVSQNEVEGSNSDVEPELPKTNGCYVSGKIQGIRTTFTLDTGATHTLISDRLYYQIPKRDRPKLHGSELLKHAWNE